MSGRKRPCSGCGRRTQALDQVCRDCTREARENEAALTGGNWRFDPFKRIQVWVPDALPEPVAQLVTGDVHSVIACPKCHARADQTCRTRRGHRTTNHKERAIPRACPCGVPVERYRQKCDDCLVHVQRAGQATRRRRKAEAEWAA